MNYTEWRPYYKMILNDFHFSESRDKKSAQVLSSILGKNFLSIDEISKIFSGNEVIIIGDSPYFSFNPAIVKGRVLVTADDATRHVLKLGMVPKLITTDLDGDEDMLINASSSGAVMGVHAHGDNIEKLNVVEKFNERFGTTQSEPLWNVFNFGGFTDGDRAVFLAHHFQAKRIILAGFNFYEPNSAKGKDLERKMKKLSYSRILIYTLIKNYRADITFL